VNIRGVEIEVVQGSAADQSADQVLTEEEAARELAGGADERSVRALCARALADAQRRGGASAALTALGIEPGQMSPVTSGKIMVQEAIRVARAGPATLRRIVFCCPWKQSYEAFAGTVNGYVRHFLEVLIWGPFVTVDAIIEAAGGIVLVKRRNPPLGYALPGGFVDYGESLETAVCREAREETGLELHHLEQFHTYSDPGRDPRFHTVTTVFSAQADGKPRAGDDAAEVHVVQPREITALAFAFDHKEILGRWLTRGRAQPA
jgi:8-oxo-dGTP diphosphatase